MLIKLYTGDILNLAQVMMISAGYLDEETDHFDKEMFSVYTTGGIALPVDVEDRDRIVRALGPVVERDSEREMESKHGEH